MVPENGELVGDQRQERGDQTEAASHSDRCLIASAPHSPAEAGASPNSAPKTLSLTLPSGSPRRRFGASVMEEQPEIGRRRRVAQLPQQRRDLAAVVGRVVHDMLDE